MANNRPGGMIDGGGGDDCIVTFDGTNYVVKGGDGKDRIVSGLPRDATSDEAFAAACGNGVAYLPFGWTMYTDKRSGGGMGHGETAVAILMVLVVGAVMLRRLSFLRPDRADGP